MDEGYTTANYTHKKIKELAAYSRGQLIGKYGVAITASLIISTIELTMLVISDMNVITTTTSGYLTSLVITLIIDLLMGVLIFGQSNFYLKLARGDKSLAIKDVFRGVKGITDKAIMVESIFTLVSFISILPSILIKFNILVIPEEQKLLYTLGEYGLQLVLVLVAKMYFGLSFYVLADHPEWTVSEIFRESLLLMKKKKGKLILTYLSLIPLLIVSFLACGIGVFWFVAYAQTLLANFYLDSVCEEAWKLEDPTAPTPPPVSDDSPTLDIRL